MRPGEIRTGRTKISLEGYPMPTARTGTARKLGAGGAVSVNGRGAPADEGHGGVPLLRNAAAAASRDPASWKYHHIGNFMLNDVLLPHHGQL
jgi:hypothetical protein